MRTVSLGLAAILGCMALTAGQAAAAEREKPKDARTLRAEAAAADAREKGMKMAPEMIAGQKLYCTLADARYVMSGNSEVEGKKSGTEFVEVACQNNLGYVVGARRDGGFVAYDCIEMSGKGSDGKDLPLKCRLEANRVPPRAFQPQLDAAGVKCAIGGASRFVGFTADATIYELTCSRADGLILTVATPRNATSGIRAIPCIAANKTDIKCTLTKPEDSASYAAAAAAAAEKVAKAADPAANRQKGMTMAPAMIAENKIPCTVTEANYLFTAKATVAGKQVESDFVEVACQNDLGYVLSHGKDNSFAAYDCIRTSAPQDGKPHPLQCKLPGNSKPHEGLRSILSASPSGCQPMNAALISLAEGANIYEVACANADGQLVVVSNPRTGATAPQFVSCYASLNSPVPCTLTPKAQSVGFVMALAAKAPKPCAPTGQRLVTSPPNGSRYYEFSCPDNTGYMVEANAAGAFVRAIPCAAAIRIAGGCKLTTAAAKAG